MQTSEYFDLGLYEGTDIFNPLIVENENIEKIDEQMFLNSIAGVGQATELKSGTVHAITRVNPDASMFRFVATSKFDRGDTFTVDGIQVTGLRTDGKALDDGAYVINANVLCCLTGTVLTLFVATGDVAKADDADRLGGELPAYYGTASDVQQAITVAQAAGVLANDLQGQVTTINSNLSELEERVDKNNFGDLIELSSYVGTTNRYTFPSDGYLQIVANGGSKTCFLSGNNEEVGENIIVYAPSATVASQVVFVKKGMKMYLTSTLNGNAYFRPLE